MHPDISSLSLSKTHVNKSLAYIKETQILLLQFTRIMEMQIQLLQFTPKSI